MSSSAGIARDVCKGVSGLRASGATITASGKGVFRVDKDTDPKHVILFRRGSASKITRALIGSQLEDGRYVWNTAVKVARGKGDAAAVTAFREFLTA